MTLAIEKDYFHVKRCHEIKYIDQKRHNKLKLTTFPVCQNLLRNDEIIYKSLIN